MQDSGGFGLLGNVRDDDLATLLLRGSEPDVKTAVDWHLASDNHTSSYFNNLIG
jgi:hypothetical protein